MNDKLLTMALMLTLIMIGINAFLYMGSVNLYDEQGQQLNLYYGLDTGGFGQQIQDKSEAIDIDSGTRFDSSLPSTNQQGLVVVASDAKPIGLDYTGELLKLGIGVQLALATLGTLFPVISPIINGIIFFAFLIQGFAVAYLGSIMIRGILGRIA